MSFSNFFYQSISFSLVVLALSKSFLLLISAIIIFKLLILFSVFFFSFFLLPAFCSLLLDRIENEKNQKDDGLVMPFSPVMRPSQMSSNQSKSSNPSFMDAYMQHLKENERMSVTTTPVLVTNITTTTTTKLENRLPMEPKQPKKPKEPKNRKPRQQTKKPREPSVKKPRQKTEKNCTTIGLHIQIRDPKTGEQETHQTVEYESNKIVYPFSSNEIEGAPASNMISTNVVTENFLPVSSSCELDTSSHTYYNMDKTENEPGEQYLYEPEPIYHVQPLGMLSNNECGNGSTPIMHNPDTNVSSNGYQIQTPLNPYNMYTEQNGNGHPILSRFNVAHTNVNNSSVVCDPLHNWRAGNEIM